MFLFGVKTDLSTRRKCAVRRMEQRFPETRCVSARINHGPCQILWEMKCQRAACLFKEKPKRQQHLQRQEIQKTFLGNHLPFVRSWQYQDPNPFAAETNYQFHLYNLWEFIKCFHGCALMDFISAWTEYVDSSAEKPLNPPASACLSPFVSFPNGSPGNCGRPSRCGLCL